MSDGEAEILIVEDNPNDAELVVRVLKKHGLGDKCLLVRDGVEALDLLLAQGNLAGANPMGDLKLVLLDLKLPKVDGLEVLRRIKAEPRTKAIPVVALTSSTEQRDLKAAYELGVNSYVTKPIEFSAFAGIVAELAKYWLDVNRLPNQEGAVRISRPQKKGDNQ